MPCALFWPYVLLECILSDLFGNMIGLLDWGATGRGKTGSSDLYREGGTWEIDFLKLLLVDHPMQ